MRRLGIRELRATLADAVRRAGAGERHLVTVDGRAVAELGPVGLSSDRPTLDDLAARGLVVPARRADRPAEPPLVVRPWAGTRLRTALREVQGRVTLALDTSALVARYLDEPASAVVVAAMAADPDWCASALALTEALAVIDRLTEIAAERARLEDAVRTDWARVVVVPLDDRCLERAAALARRHPLRTVDALHLAAADRLPRPVAYATVEAGQIPVALELGFTVVSATS